MSSQWKKGDRVRLWQVEKAQYEGKQGTIAGKYNRRKKRWPVELDFNGKTVNVQTKNLRRGQKKQKTPPEIMETATATSKGSSKKKQRASVRNDKFKVGDRVQLVNVTKKKFEGKLGTISGALNTTKMRWPVTLDEESKKVNLKPENLKLIPNTNDAQEAGSNDADTVVDNASADEGDAGAPKQADADNENEEEVNAVASEQAEPAAKEAEPAGTEEAEPEAKEEAEKEETSAPAETKAEEDEPSTKAPNQANDIPDTAESQANEEPATSADNEPEKADEAEKEEETEPEKEAEAVKKEEAEPEKEAEAEKQEETEPEKEAEATAAEGDTKEEDVSAAAKEPEKQAVENDEEASKVESDAKEEDASPAEKEPEKQATENDEEASKVENDDKVEEASAEKEPEKQAGENDVEASPKAGGDELPEENEAPPAEVEVPQQQEEQKVDLSKYAKLLPVDRTHEETQRRHQMFQDIDQSGNGHLSLAEIELGVKNFLGEEIFLMKPAIKLAYKAARGIAPEEDHDDDAFVEFKEFRIFLAMVRQYIELYAAFDAIDSGDDDRISIKEFKSSIEMLSDWGIKVTDPEETFSEIDTNGGGQVLFEEFCRWAMNKHLDYDKTFDDGESEAKLQKVEVEEDENEYKPFEAEEDDESKQRSEKEIDLAKFASMLPVGRTHDETQTRHKMFNDMDVSGNGQLSLAEIDAGIQSFLGEELDMGPAIKMAYKIARDIDKGDDDGEDFVTFSEFRILMVNVRKYMELNAAFDAIDSGEDHRINLEEFSTALDMLKDWGITIDDPDKAFAEIDENGGGQVLFEEFCHWALKKGLDYDDELATGDAKAVAKAIEIDDKSEDEPEPAKPKAKTYEKVELDDLAAKLPVGRSNEEAVKRKEMFDAMDSSGNDQLSLAEIDLGILNFLGEEFHLMKPAIRMAYRSSRGVDPRGSMDASFVEYTEFRMLLVNTRRYIELFAAFEAVDDGDDNRIDLAEFSNSLGMLEEWGIKVTDPEKTFAEIDENGGGQVLFNEFAHWALKAGLDYDSDVDEGDAKAKMQEVDLPDEPEDPLLEEDVNAAPEIKVEIDFEALTAKLPVGDTKEDKKARKAMFESIDQSGSGSLSLAEIELGVLNFMGEEAAELKKAIRMAYKVAKEGRGGKEDDYVERKEMKTLLLCLKRYFELWAAFEAIDTGDDSRIDLKEFEAACDIIESWGVELEIPSVEFKKMDSNDGGQVLFGEFCTWALKMDLDVDDEVDSE